MGDKFENIKNSKIINRSKVTEAKAEPKGESPKEDREEAKINILKKLLEEGETEKCIEELKSLLSKSDSSKGLLNGVILNSSKLNQWTEQLSFGLISLHEFNLEQTKIYKNLLEIIDKI